MKDVTKTIWEEFGIYIRNFIVSKVGNKSDVEDIFQDVFLKIHSNINTLKDENKMQSWIFQITRNCITDYYRSGKSDYIEAGEGFSEHEETDLEYETKLENVTSGLESIIDSLPEKYAKALKRVEIDGIAQTDLAQELDISVSGAKLRVQRGRKLVKDVLLDCCKFQFDKYGTFIDYEKKIAFIAFKKTRFTEITVNLIQYFKSYG
ncbi:RNA polymerase sigma factor SigZ [Plebeiibacterium sediminum]|uniref:RNA polymerase sigma factor SigZ n=1 Tax=Plebeiibacterium sediminum TaxID=2992112 RepID=A0AAE3M8E8_9BACT|nr:RNA polymerase sigma factor SigZ [Plebeiobacterium sediminum]MCW3789149.1 RNA polymerase sigma factor SigZ [Plebeiobacterium sediminum]